jgi:SAM-dependent methyltransferase
MASIYDVKKYWDNRPCNIRHSPKEVGSFEWSKEVLARKYFVEPHIKRFADFDAWKGKKVLEIGCGIGSDTVSFALAGAYVTAVDLSEESLKLAEKRIHLHGLSNQVQFYQGNAEDLTNIVPLQTFDLIYSFGVIHHTPNPDYVLKKIRLYMGEHSVFKIMMYHKMSYKVLWIILRYGWGAWWNASKLTAKYSEAQTGCPVTFAYTKKSLSELLTGFEVTDCFVDHIFPYKIKEYKKYIYKKVWYFRFMPAGLFRWLESKIGWHLCATCVRRSLSAKK